MARRPVDAGWSHAPGPGDLTNPSDPQNDTPGDCAECEGNHPTSRCPAVARHVAAQRRRNRKEHAA